MGPCDVRTCTAAMASSSFARSSWRWTSRSFLPASFLYSCAMSRAMERMRNSVRAFSSRVVRDRMK